jgi:hypothetical protein
MDKKQSCLIVFATVQTLVLNGLLETNNYVGWTQSILSVPRIFLVLLEIIGQYDMLHSLFTYARRIVIQKDLEIHSSKKPEKQVMQVTSILSEAPNRNPRIHVVSVCHVSNRVLSTRLINYRDNNFIAKTAHTEKEACQLIRKGFEYVCDIDGNKLFRKPK